MHSRHPMNTDNIRSALFSTSTTRSGNGSNSLNNRPAIQLSSSASSSSSSRSNGNASMNDRIYAEQSERHMESQNDHYAHILSEKVGILKTVTIDLQNELALQNKELTEMDSDFEKTQMMMKKALGNIVDMMKSGGSKHMCYLVGFIFAIFLLVWWLVR